jgi:serine/threonine protein kinase
MAMKTCDITEYQKHSSGLELIENELRILSHIEDDEVKHPNISRFHFAFHDTCSLYLAFELHTSGDLRYHLKKDKTTFDERGVAFIAICLADALTHLHARGILHRDIKPENILMDEAGFPHLTDFGVSYIDTQGGQELECCLGSGTREYMAPEVLSKTRQHGAEADFWSLGVVLFELLFRARPFEKRCPSPFVKLTNYLLKHDARLTSTGSKHRHEHRYEHSHEHEQTVSVKEANAKPAVESAPQQQHTASEEATAASSSTQQTTLDPATPSPAPLPRSLADYQFSSAEHRAYVAKAVSSNVALDFKLRDLQFQASGERETKTASLSPSPPPPASSSSSKHLSSLALELPAVLRVPIQHPHKAAEDCPSDLCADVVGRLLDPRVWHRLGAGARFRPLKQHAWFSQLGLQWEAVVARKCPSPININQSKVNFDCTYKYLFEEIFDDIEISPQKDAPVGLTVKERAILDRFHYISPFHCSSSSTREQSIDRSTKKKKEEKKNKGKEARIEEEEEEEAAAARSIDVDGGVHAGQCHTRKEQSLKAIDISISASASSSSNGAMAVDPADQ